MNPLNPDQLPDKNAQFIAYGSPERVADPFGGEDPLSVRPQVFVRYYRGIKIKELAAPRSGAADTVKVVFDPESVGLSNEFSAYMNSDDPVVEYLRSQVEAGAPVDVGLEYVRRKRTKDTKDEISPVVPIHALRGANAADGSGDNSTMMGAAGKNVRSVVGLINGRRSANGVSDPREWRLLVSNRKGDLPPAGWKALLDREDWTKVGAIVPKSDPPAGTAQQPQQSGAGIDMNVLAKVVRHEALQALKTYGEDLLRQDAAEQGQPTSREPSFAVEGKPWNTRVNKDHLNLGSYLVTGEGHALRWAYRHLRTIGDDTLVGDPSIRWEAAQELADATQQIADGVQAAAYNGEVRADRTSASFTEAVRWVRFHVEETYPFGVDEDFDYENWFSRVGRAATESMTQAETNAFAFLEARNPKAAQQSENTASAEATEGAKGPEDSEAPTDEADKEHVLEAFLQMLTQGWEDKDRILTLAREASTKGLMDAVVWANPREGAFATSPFDGGQEFSISTLTKRQYELLNQAAQAETPTDGNGQNQQEKAPQDAQETTASPQQQSQGGSNVQHIAAALSRATSSDQIGTIYREVRDNNLLTSTVEVKRGTGTFGITPVPPGTDPEAEPMALGDLFDALRAALANSNDTSDGQATQQEAAPAQDGDPQQQDAPEGTLSPQGEPAETPPGDGALAQQIADQAAQTTTTDDLKSFLAQANEQGVANDEVTIKGTSGPLHAYLESQVKRVSRAGK